MVGRIEGMAEDTHAGSFLFGDARFVFASALLCFFWYERRYGWNMVFF